MRANGEIEVTYYNDANCKTEVNKDTVKNDKDQCQTSNNLNLKVYCEKNPLKSPRKKITRALTKIVFYTVSIKKFRVMKKRRELKLILHEVILHHVNR